MHVKIQKRIGNPTLYNAKINYSHLDITNNDAITSYDFQMRLWGEDATSNYALSVIQSFLDVDWKKLFDEVQTKSPAPIDMTMTLTIPDTDYQVIGVLSIASMPEHILN